MATEEKKARKVRRGIVVSDKMDKTVVVRVERLTRHPQYTRIVKRAKKFKAHDEHNECAMGDLVEIVETRPLSKDKRWRVTQIVRKGTV
ncbi:30S ribosomal protein S17 [candidate division KSB3 bacterium]|uniref:Small ribosomal subunit protein uS17 n=1 Tax=candidate division KSB3 bacterium TaxID=2044937 RepID=A0A9D5Q808_9BACT|nr:30S ribosomal protein S17 [candidate division KSB3 bacterium]MBD3326998.1 30S ribosomal protein S17 [candidate division KSB3 bacterium]